MIWARALPAGHEDWVRLPDHVAEALGIPRNPDSIVPRPSGRHREYFIPKVVRVGEDGRFAMAHGHLNQTFFTCLLAVAEAADSGHADLLVEALEQDDPIPVEHTYALERTFPAGEEDDVGWDGQARPGERFIDYGGDITADPPAPSR
ncbi:MAG TPA: hypothetical protein VIL48_15920 [Acidimicrobiales bacterium]